MQQVKKKNKMGSSGAEVTDSWHLERACGCPIPVTLPTATLKGVHLLPPLNTSFVAQDVAILLEVGRRSHLHSVGGVPKVLVSTICQDKQ